MTGEFQNVIPLLGIAPKRESNSPGSGIDGRIFDAGFVLDRVRIDWGVALDDMKRIGRKVTRHVQPRIGSRHGLEAERSEIRKVYRSGAVCLKARSVPADRRMSGCCVDRFALLMPQAYMGFSCPAYR